MSRNWYLTAMKVGLVGLLSLTVSVAQAAPRADHTTVDASSIPQAALDNARALHMSFSHASVGGNIWEGLSVLSTQSSSRYAFPNWTQDPRGNPGWQAKVDDFETYVADHLSGTSVFLNKFCYIDQDASFSYYRDSMVKLAGLYPSKTFVWFTMPIQTSDPDNSLRQAFNAQVRTYTTQNNLPLFDLADIESHQADGTPVTDGGKEAMASEWSIDGGHLNASGSARAASAMWWLMAQLGGWTNGTGGTGGQVDAGATGGSQADAAVTGGSVASSGGSVAATGGSGGSTSSGGSIAGTGGTGGQVDAGDPGGSQADAAVTGGNQIDAAVTGGNQADAAVTGGNQIDAAITGGNVVDAGGDTATTVGTGGTTGSATGGTVVGAGGSVTAADGGETAATGGGGAGGPTTAGGTTGDTGGAYGIGGNVATGGNTAVTIGTGLPGTVGAPLDGGLGGAIASAGGSATSTHAASGGTAADGGIQPKSTGIAKSTNGESSGCSCSLSGASNKRGTTFFGLFAIVCVLVAARRRRR